MTARGFTDAEKAVLQMWLTWMDCRRRDDGEDEFEVIAPDPTPRLMLRWFESASNHIANFGDPSDAIGRECIEEMRRIAREYAYEV